MKSCGLLDQFSYYKLSKDSIKREHTFLDLFSE
jgi:hypothetical protein